MKEILLSVKPEWLAKILNGEKTLEIRKTIPKCKFPIKVWLYCTNSNKKLFLDKIDNKYHYGLDSKKDKFDSLNDKVVGYFTLKNVETCYIQVIEPKKRYSIDFESQKYNFKKFLKESCLSNEQLLSYLENKKNILLYGKFYAWKIEDLTILDKPFSLLDDEHLSNPKTCLRISKAPQSWCYCCHSMVIK